MRDILTRTSRPQPGDGPVVVYMASRGIGDVVWHVAALRGIAAATPEGSVVFVTRPTTHAADVLRHEPAVSRTVYVPYLGKRAKWREVGELRDALEALRPRAVWVMDETWRPALAALLAGVPDRQGMGETFAQRLLLTEGKRLKGPKGDKLARLSALLRLWNLPEAEEPLLSVDPAESARVASAFARLPRPWIGYGLTSSDPDRIWPEERFHEVARALGGTTFFLGGPNDAGIVSRAVSACGGQGVAGWPLQRAMALISQLDMFVGNDSGPLNLAAGTGVPSVGVFGPSLITYSRHLYPVRSRDRTMEGLGVDFVVETCRSVLNAGRRPEPVRRRKAG
jgi:heptosyltransferase-2